MVNARESSSKVKRHKYFGLKTCLLATETIPAGTFLFHNLSEMIDLYKGLSVRGYRSKITERMASFGAGKVFLVSLSNDQHTNPKVGTGSKPAPSYQEAQEAKWDFRFINWAGNPKLLKKQNVELREWTSDKNLN